MFFLVLRHAPISPELYRLWDKCRVAAACAEEKQNFLRHLE